MSVSKHLAVVLRALPLPQPIGSEVATDGFPVYGASPRRPQPGPQSEEGPFTERSK